MYLLSLSPNLLFISDSPFTDDSCSGGLYVSSIFVSIDLSDLTDLTRLNFPRDAGYIKDLKRSFWRWSWRDSCWSYLISSSTIILKNFKLKLKNLMKCNWKFWIKTELSSRCWLYEGPEKKMLVARRTWKEWLSTSGDKQLLSKGIGPKWTSPIPWDWATCSLIRKWFNCQEARHRLWSA